MDRHEETKAVKNALRDHGIPARVKHGVGTAWGWLDIYVGSNPYPHLCQPFQQFGGVRQFGGKVCSTKDCLACKWYEILPGEALRVAQAVTGRTGESARRISILTQ